MNYPASERKPISENERIELGKAINGFGKLTQTVKISGVSEPTIRHAIGGFNLNPDVRQKIRKFLKSQAVKA